MSITEHQPELPVPGPALAGQDQAAELPRYDTSGVPENPLDKDTTVTSLTAFRDKKLTEAGTTHQVGDYQRDEMDGDPTPSDGIKVDDERLQYVQAEAGIKDSIDKTQADTFQEIGRQLDFEDDADKILAEVETDPKLGKQLDDIAELNDRGHDAEATAIHDAYLKSKEMINAQIGQTQLDADELRMPVLGARAGSVPGPDGLATRKSERAFDAAERELGQDVLRVMPPNIPGEKLL